MKNKAFTLVELLVVIVIIGILATISIGTFQGYFTQARDAQRLSTISSIATIIKTSQATQETNQYVFTTKEQVYTVLEQNGLSFKPNECEYVYGSRAGDFFIASIKEEDNSFILNGTANGINDSEAANISFSLQGLSGCIAPNVPTGYTIVFLD